MRSKLGAVAATCLLVGSFAPAKAQDPEGTLKKVKETGTFTVGHRDSSIPLSYLDDKLRPVGFSIELCRRVVEAVKTKLGMPDLKVAYMSSRQKQVAFSYTFFVPNSNGSRAPAAASAARTTCGARRSP